MRKSVLAKIMACTVAAACAVPSAVWAEEAQGQGSSWLNGAIGILGGLMEDGGVVDQLVGEGGALSEYVPEGMDVKEIVGDAVSQLEDEDSELRQSLDMAAGMVVGEDGSIDLEQLANLAAMFLGDDQTEESFDLGEFSEEDGFAVKHTDTLMAGVGDYYDEMQMSEDGDVRLLSPMYAKTRLLEDGTALVLCDVTMMNFTENGTDLVLLNGATRTHLLTVRPDADGQYEVTDVETAEEGEEYTESVEFMCTEAEIEPSEFFELQSSMSEMTLVGYLMTFLQEHSEYERIEYMGELATESDLQERMTELTLAMYPDLWGPEGALTEAVTE